MLMQIVVPGALDPLERATRFIAQLISLKQQREFQRGRLGIEQERVGLEAERVEVLKETKEAAAARGEAEVGRQQALFLLEQNPGQPFTPETTAAHELLAGAPPTEKIVGGARGTAQLQLDEAISSLITDTDPKLKAEFKRAGLTVPQGIALARVGLGNFVGTLAQSAAGEKAARTDLAGFFAKGLVMPLGTVKAALRAIETEAKPKSAVVAKAVKAIEALQFANMTQEIPSLSDTPAFKSMQALLGELGAIDPSEEPEDAAVRAEFIRKSIAEGMLQRRNPNFDQLPPEEREAAIARILKSPALPKVKVIQEPGKFKSVVNFIIPFGDPLKGKKKLGLEEPEVTPSTEPTAAAPPAGEVEGLQQEDALALMQIIFEMFPELQQQLQPQP